MDYDGILEILGKIDSNLRTRVKAIIIGGSAMAILKDKVTTKDIDMVFLERNELDEFIGSSKRSGFETKSSPLEDDDAWAEAYILRDEKGNRLDLFTERICRKFLVHEGIIQRCSSLRPLRNIQAMVMSPEDIFISKSVTGRKVDLADMFALYQKGLDETIIIQELEKQSENSEMIWEAFMAVKMDEIEKEFDVTIPVKKKIRSIAERKIKASLKP